MKTIKEYLESLPEPARAQALKNLLPSEQDKEAENLSDALLGAFEWAGSPEGHKYWMDVECEMCR